MLCLQFPSSVLDNAFQILDELHYPTINCFHLFIFLLAVFNIMNTSIITQCLDKLNTCKTWLFTLNNSAINRAYNPMGLKGSMWEKQFFLTQGHSFSAYSYFLVATCAKQPLINIHSYIIFKTKPY